MAATGPGKISQTDLAVLLNQVEADIAILRTELLALRGDFLSHDHGNTGSYVQAAITKRAVPNTTNGTALTSTGVLVTTATTAVSVPAAP